MSERYWGHLVEMYRSRIDGEKLFRTPAEARAFDTELAFTILRETRLDTLHAAFERRNERLAMALKFLADETDLSPEPVGAAA